MSVCGEITKDPNTATICVYMKHIITIIYYIPIVKNMTVGNQSKSDGNFKAGIEVD